MRKKLLQPCERSSAIRAARHAFAEMLESRTLLSATVPDGFTDSTLTTGFFSPTSMSFVPDGSNRIFVTEQTGAIRVVKNGQLLTTPFATINCTNFGEHGLLGLTFDPNFTTNHYVYIYYTTPVDNNGEFHNRLARLTANGDVAAGAETDLFDADDLDTSQLYHDAGGLHFGPDGELYVSTGENEHPENSQDLTNLEGKVLRLNSDGSIPTDNPFYNTLTGKNRAIWAYGLRNPFTYAFQDGTGLMYINDVGQDSYEEINQGAAGANYGWPQQEGANGLGQNGITDPIYYYPHVGDNNAITGGVFYPATGPFPSQYLGQYFFADIGRGFIEVLNPDTHQETDFATNVGAPVDLDIGADGSLYYLGRLNAGDTRDDSGFISVIRFSSGEAPDIVSQPTDTTVGKGQSATFTVSASGQTPITYQWQKNAHNIPGATDASYTLSSAALSNDGDQYRVVVTNPIGHVVSASGTLNVLDDTAPTPTITAPLSTATFYGGQTITYSGTATDAEDGTLPASAFTWQVDYHTGVVTRPFVQPVTGSMSGTFVGATITPYTRPDVFYRVILTVTDSAGLSTTVTRDVQPRTASITVKTNYSAFNVTVDGQDTAAGGTTFTGVQGITREINAPDTQTLNGRTYVFDHWSDGGDQDHEISTPGKRFNYIAYYVPQVAKGLQGTYFNNKNQTGTQITRIDNTINFNFGNGKPDPAIAVGSWSARWSGKFQAATDDTYNFSVTTDGGVRLRVNGQIVINSITPANSVRTLSGSISLTGGQKYAIILEYIHDTGTAQIQFNYNNSTNDDQVVPTGLLYAPIAQLNSFAPSGDSYVQGGASANTNFGGSSSLLVKSYKTADFERDTYLEFDLSNLSVITSAKLKIFGKLSSEDNSDVVIGAYGADNTGFDESSINYNNRPAQGALISTAIVSTSTTAQYYILDLTAYIKSVKASGQNTAVILLQNLQRTVTTTNFNSKEASSNQPELDIAS